MAKKFPSWHLYGRTCWARFTPPLLLCHAISPNHVARITRQTCYVFMCQSFQLHLVLSVSSYIRLFKCMPQDLSLRASMFAVVAVWRSRGSGSLNKNSAQKACAFQPCDEKWMCGFEGAAVWCCCITNISAHWTTLNKYADKFSVAMFLNASKA